MFSVLNEVNSSSFLSRERWELGGQWGCGSFEGIWLYQLMKGLKLEEAEGPQQQVHPLLLPINQLLVTETVCKCGECELWWTEILFLLYSSSCTNWVIQNRAQTRWPCDSIWPGYYRRVVRWGFRAAREECSLKQASNRPSTATADPPNSPSLFPQTTTGQSVNRAPEALLKNSHSLQVVERCQS